MAYDGRLMRRARERYEASRADRNADFRERRAAVYRKSPRIKQIDTQLSTTMAQIIASAIRRGTDPKPAINVIRDKNLELQRERAELLTGLGYPIDYLDEKPACARCGDTGFAGAEPCACLKIYYSREQIKELSKLLNLGAQSFDSFDFDFYSQDAKAGQGISPRENIEMIYEICSDYAHKFGPRSGNLFLSGAPGLGKTFLSACIAREVSENGFSVVYDTAMNIFSRFEAQKFSHDESAEADVNRYLGCDLLIIDDLGTEMTTPFVQTALYQVMNGRIVTERKTIINSNLTSGELENRYTPQILSRLDGEYRKLRFFGDDIRKLKKLR